MAVITSEAPSHRVSPEQASERKTAAQEHVVERFRESVVSMAEALGDMNTLLRHSYQNRARFMVEDAFACMWKDSKRQLGGDADEGAKAILRSAGASEPFMNAIHSIVNWHVGNSQRHRDDQVHRFRVALRFAVHLSPDRGDAILQELDRKLHPSHSSCPLSILNAYQAFKVRGSEG